MCAQTLLSAMALVYLTNTAVDSAPRTETQPANGAPSYSVCVAPRPVRAVAFTDDDSLLAVAGEFDTIILWECAREARWTELATESNYSVTAVTFSPTLCSPQLFAAAVRTAPSKGSIVMWDLAIGDVVQRIPYVGEVIVLGFSADGREVHAGFTMGDSKGSIIAWNTKTGEMLRSYGASGLAVPMTFGCDNSSVLQVINGSGLKLWSTNGTLIGEAQVKYEIESGLWHVVDYVSMSSDCKRAVTMDRDSDARLWSLPNMRHERLIGTFGRGASIVGLFPDGRTIFMSDEEGFLRIQSVESNRFQRIQVTPDLRRTARGAISPSGRYAATIHQGKRGGDPVAVWHFPAPPNMSDK
jgi:WD40 repeat protein